MQSSFRKIHGLTMKGTPAEPDPQGICPVIVTSFRCNYACEYCYQASGKACRDRLKPEDIPAIHHFYKEFCSRYSIPLVYDGVSVIGGEPLLPENRPTLLAVSEQWPDCTLQFTTNGACLPEYLDFLLSRRSVVRVSLDGTKDTHYSRRRPSDPAAYGNAVLGIRQLLRNDRDVTVMTVFSPHHTEDYPLFFDFLENLGWLHSKHLRVGFIPEVGCGTDDISRGNVLRNLNAFQSLLEKDPRAAYVDARKLLPGGTALADALRLAASGRYDPYRCGSLSEPSYTFFPDGSVRACLSMQNADPCIGRFMPEIIINESYIRRLAERRIDRMGACRACPVRVLCRGGCPATAEKKTGDAAAPYCGFWKEGHFLSYYEMIMRCSQ